MIGKVICVILLLDPSQFALQLGSVVKEDVDQALLQLEHCLETFFLILKWPLQEEKCHGVGLKNI